MTHEAQMTELREKVKKAIRQAWLKHDFMDPDFANNVADAALSIAIEECAKVADRIAANPPSNDARHIDWQAGVQDGAMESAASIRVLAEKP